MFDTAMKMEGKNVNDVTQRANRFVRRENRTRIPTQLKERMEQSTGLCLDDVRVHYNSALPAKLDALAYTKGNQVEIGPGQERHLSHELGHVVQQKLGMMRANARHTSGEALNTDAGLERQADEIGAGKRVAVIQKRENNVVQRCTEETVPEITDKDIAAEDKDKDAPVYQTGEGAGDGEKDDKLFKNLAIAKLIDKFSVEVSKAMEQISQLAKDVDEFHEKGMNKLDELSQRVKEKTKSEQALNSISDDMTGLRELQTEITEAMKESKTAAKETAENLGVAHLKILNVGAGIKPIPGATNIDKNPTAGLGVIRADANGLKARDAIFDYALALNPYGYSPVNSDVPRVLKPGGKIYVTGSMKNKYFKTCHNPDPDLLKEKKLKQVSREDEKDNSLFMVFGGLKSNGKPVESAIRRTVFEKENQGAEPKEPEPL